MGDTRAIRAASLADVPGLVPVVNRAYEHERWLIPGPRTTERELAAEILEERSVVLVASVADAPVGTVRVRPLEPEEAELGLLAVDPALHHRGLGAALVAAAERWGKEAGFLALRLECGRELGLVPFYAGLGYTVVKEDLGVHLSSFRPFTLVTMRKELR